jgi:hypothetical protein
VSVPELKAATIDFYFAPKPVNTKSIFENLDVME